MSKQLVLGGALLMLWERAHEDEKAKVGFNGFVFGEDVCLIREQSSEAGKMLKVLAQMVGSQGVGSKAKVFFQPLFQADREPLTEEFFHAMLGRGEKTLFFGGSTEFRRNGAVVARKSETRTEKVSEEVVQAGK